MKEKAIIKFLKEHPLIAIQKLEKECKIPLTTINQVVSGKRGLPEAYITPLEDVLKNYGYNKSPVFLTSGKR